MWATRASLLGQGWTVHRIARAVHAGELIRVRRDRYATPEEPADAQRAVRVGGRLTCISELRHRGIWVVDDGMLHVALAPNAARSRDPDDRAVPFRREAHCRRHWMRSDARAPARAPAHVQLVDAFVHARHCLPDRHLLAALDSAIHLEMLGPDQLDALAAADPRLAALVARADGRAESGLESIVRDALVALGLRVRVQARIGGVGRVDLLVEGCVVVETDGAAFHGGEVALRDRRRDARAAARGLTPLRFRYGQVLDDLSEVVSAVVGAVASHRRARFSGRRAAALRHRANRMLPS